ncbi:MAG: hypothetical protein ACTSW1_10050 [Candidatus Hodarchaeales archaeon]
MTRRGGEIDAEREILFTIKKLGSCTFTDIVEESDITRGTVGKYLKISIEKQFVSANVGEMNGRRTIIYRLTEKGMSLYNKKISEDFLSTISEPISTNNLRKNEKILVSIIADSNSINPDYRKPIQIIDQILARAAGEIEEIDSAIQCDKFACIIMYDKNGFQLF